VPRDQITVVWGLACVLAWRLGSQAAAEGHRKVPGSVSFCFVVGDPGRDLGVEHAGLA